MKKKEIEFSSQEERYRDLVFGAITTYSKDVFIKLDEWHELYSKPKGKNPKQVFSTDYFLDTINSIVETHAMNVTD